MVPLVRNCRGRKKSANRGCPEAFSPTEKGHVGEKTTNPVEGVGGRGSQHDKGSREGRGYSAGEQIKKEVKTARKKMISQKDAKGTTRPVGGRISLKGVQKLEGEKVGKGKGEGVRKPGFWKGPGDTH